MASPINRILISRMKFIGDVILTTPVIRRVRAQFPDAFISFLGDANAVSLLEGNPHLNEIIPYDFSRNDIAEQGRAILALRRRRFDVFIDLFCNPRTALLAYASGASMRIGKAVKGRGRLYTHPIEDNGKPKSAIDFHFQYLAPLGIGPANSSADEYRTEIVLSGDERRKAVLSLRAAGFNTERPILGIHPGATWPAKRWPVEHFAALARAAADLGIQVAFTQSPADAVLVREIIGRSTGAVRALPVMPLRQLAGVISCMRAYVANDNGTMHIAAAVGTKTLGIFGPGEENIWFPYIPPYRNADAGHRVLRHDVPCHPCHLDFCNRTGDGYMECMRGLAMADVLQELRSMLNAS